MSFEMTALLLTWVAIALLGLAMAGILRQVNHLVQGPARRAAAPGSMIGTRAPAIPELPDPPSQPTLLLFANRSCAGCERVVPWLERRRLEDDGVAAVVLYPDDAPSGSTSAALRVLDHQQQSFSDYHVPVTPFAVAVAPNGIITRAAPAGSVELLESVITASRTASR